MKGVHKDVVAPLLKLAWFLQGDVKFVDLSFDMILAIFETKQDKLKVIEGGPWTGDGWAIAVGEWDVDRYANNVIPTMVPMWVQVHNLPLVLIQDQYEDRFGWLIGVPVDVSKTSLVVHESVVQKNFLRVHVLVDSTQPLVDGCYVFEEDEEEPLWVEFKYERLPKYCLKCARLTHDTSSCSLKNVDGDGFLYAYLRADPNNREGKFEGRRPQGQKEAAFKSPELKQGNLAITEFKGVKRANACSVEEKFGRKREVEHVRVSNSKEGKAVWENFDDELYKGMTNLVPSLIGGFEKQSPVWISGPNLSVVDPFEIKLIEAPLTSAENRVVSGPRFREFTPDQEFEIFFNLNNQPYLLNQGETNDFLLQDIVVAAKRSVIGIVAKLSGSN
ncbi:hypothetical protein QQ045_022044 [Rhodiola kirilowii]